MQSVFIFFTMAAVHFVITIPTKKEETRHKKCFQTESPKTSTISYPSAQLTSNTSDSGDVCNTNLLIGAQSETIPTKRKTKETGNALGGDITDNKASSSSSVNLELDTDIEAGVSSEVSVQTATAWDGLRDLLSSARHTKGEQHVLNLPPDTCMEVVIKELLAMFEIDNAVWTMDNNGERLQVSFTVDMNDKYEKILEVLTDWGIGERRGSTVSVMNCISFMTSVKQDGDEEKINGENVNQQKQSAWERLMASVQRRLNVVQLVRDIRQDASITFDFIVLVVSAAILAAFGLIEDSSIFLAASMLISPLMGPIIAAIFGTVIKDSSLCLLGICNELMGVMMATFVGFVFGLVVCSIDDRYGVGEGITNEMLTRCDLHSLVVGIFTALASGAAAAVGVLGGNIGSLIGVAISASLLPPAVNAGLLWALAVLYTFHESDNSRYHSVIKNIFYSNNQAAELVILGSISMSLTLLNVICVYIMGIIVLKIKEIAPVKSLNNRQFWKQDIKIARDLHKKRLDSDATIIDELAGLPVEDQTILSLRNDFINSTYLGRPWYQNTWSPSGNQTHVDDVQLPLGYRTVHHFKALCSNLDKRSVARFKNISYAQRKLNNRAVDLGHYSVLKENASPIQTATGTMERKSNDNNHSLLEFTSCSNTPQSTVERKKRNFIVTPVTMTE